MNPTLLLILGAAAYFFWQKSSSTPTSTGIAPTGTVVTPSGGTAIITSPSLAPTATLNSALANSPTNSIPYRVTPIVPALETDAIPLPPPVMGSVQWSTPLDPPWTGASYSYYGPSKQQIHDYLSSLGSPQPENVWTEYLNDFAGTAFVDNNTGVMNFSDFWAGPASQMLGPQGIGGLGGWEV